MVNKLTNDSKCCKQKHVVILINYTGYLTERGYKRKLMELKLKELEYENKEGMVNHLLNSVKWQ